MNQHKYLRAYMAGIVVPTIVLVMGVTAFCIARYAYDFPVPLERLMIFPMAVVPNLWGLWNMLFVASHSRTHLSIGFHGALLPFLLGPLGIILTGLLNFSIRALPARLPDPRAAQPDCLLPRLEVCGRLSKPSCRSCMSFPQFDLFRRAGSRMRKRE